MKSIFWFVLSLNAFVSYFTEYRIILWISWEFVNALFVSFPPLVLIFSRNYHEFEINIWNKPNTFISHESNHNLSCGIVRGFDNLKFHRFVRWKFAKNLIFFSDWHNNTFIWLCCIQNIFVLYNSRIKSIQISFFYNESSTFV